MINYPATSSLFVYGTLMSPQVLRVLIGRLPELVHSATLEGYRRHPVKGQSFPGMIAGVGSVQGMLLKELTVSEMNVLDWFEGEEYTRKDVNIQCGTTLEMTQTYVWSNPLSDLDTLSEWSYEDFCDFRLDSYLSHTVKPCRIKLNELAIGVYDH